jgi:hypothetical protein
MMLADTNARLHAIGWTALRLWLHESPVIAAQMVAHVVAKADTKPRASAPGANEEN